MNNKNKQEKTWTFKEIPSKKNKERLAQWISQEITSQEYTQKEIDALIYLFRNGKKEEAWKILLKGHKCPNTCYCQKKTKTWQEKINKAQLLLQLAEREGNEAEKLRVRETACWLSQQFKQQHE
ncbi:MAG: hypothetical protein MRECE_48c005 [Mycoplasmataceae bacterium CE_OT135]|nr:MAG: hypothetical protein MRECE_48c005 [Mycoplasmataceae bacterium CE_OT135]